MKRHLTKIPVGHVYYKLDRSAKLPKYQYGETDFEKQTISISDRLDSPSNWSLTFWHEFFHGALHELGWTDEQYSEAKVEGLAHCMMRLLTDPAGRILLINMLNHLKKLDPDKSLR